MGLYQNNFVKNDVSFILNVIRIIAAELVLLGHILAYNKLSKQYLPAFTELNKLVFPFYKVNAIEIADFGLFLFVILSGVLISNSVFSKLKKGKYNFIEYFIDRGSRIYSGLIPCLLIIFVLDYIHLTFFPGHFILVSTMLGDAASFVTEFSLINFVGSLLLLNHLPLQSLDIGYGFGTAKPLWSLPIEWWLYLSFGWFIIQFKQIRAKKWAYILVFLALSAIPLGYILKYITSYQSNGMLIFVWLSGIVITILLSSYNILDIVRFKLIIAAILISFGLAYMSTKYSGFSGTVFNPVSLILIIIAFLFVLSHLKNTTYFGNKKITKAIQFIANYTFTLYLIHMPIILLINILQFPDPNLLIISSFVITNLCAIPIAYFTEMRHKELSNWLKKKFSIMEGAT